MMKILLVIALIGADKKPDDTAETRTAIQALAALYEQNRNAFQSFSFEFEYEDGIARNIEHAVSGELSKSYKTTGNYKRTGKNLLFTCVFPTEAMAATTTVRGNMLSGRLMSHRFLNDGRATLVDSLAAKPDGTLVRGTTIAAGASRMFSDFDFPLDLGFPDQSRRDFGSDARAILERPSELPITKFDNQSQDLKTPTIFFSFSYPGATKKFWLDPAKSAVPVRVTIEPENGNAMIEHYGDIRFIQGKGWLPFYSVMYDSHGLCRRLKITKAEFTDSPIEAFQLEFPTPIGMRDADAKLTYAPRRIWNLNKLPKRGSPDAHGISGSTAVALEPEMPLERPWQPPYATIAVLILAVATVGIGFYSKLKSANQHSPKS